MERLAADVIEQTLKCVEQCLSDAELTREGIDHVVGVKPMRLADLIAVHRGDRSVNMGAFIDSLRPVLRSEPARAGVGAERPCGSTDRRIW